MMLSPRSTLIDLALDIVDDDGAGSSSTSDISFLLDFSNNFKTSQSQLFSASRQSQSQSQLLSAARKPHKSKSVHFDEYDEVAEIPHVNDFSQKKIDRLWFSREEQSEIREECLELVERFESGEAMDKEEVMLGLEKQTKACHKQFLKLRRIIKKGVFRLQKVQQRTSVAEPNFIAEFCELSSAKPALQARLSALKLALEVKTEIGLPKTIQKV